MTEHDAFRQRLLALDTVDKVSEQRGIGRGSPDW